MADIALTAEDVAKLLHISKNTVYELIRRGEINSYKVGRKIRFTQEDVDHYIARFRHEKQFAPVTRANVQNAVFGSKGQQKKDFIISGQDAILDILSNLLIHEGVMTLRAYLGSFESLFSLYQDKVQVATCHLWAGDTERYNVDYVRRMMPGTHAVIINLSYREQGFYVKKGNPKKIKTWKDLIREDVVFLNRRKSNASRILLDENLMRLGIRPEEINGYESEIGSHLTLANAIINGEADTGIGTKRVCDQKPELAFVPLQTERFDMVIKKSMMDSPEVQLMLEVLNSEEYRMEINGISGNDYRDMGKIVAEI